MTIENPSTLVDNLQQKAFHALANADYSGATTLYQQIIEVNPEGKLAYWHMGLALLLQGEEAEAQTTWMLAMVEGEPEQIEQWAAELDQVLQLEAERQEALDESAIAWTLRQHRRELNPYNLTNLLQLVQLSIKLKQFEGKDFETLGILELLQSGEAVEVDTELLRQVLKTALDYAPLDPDLPAFAEACLPYADPPQAFIRVLMLAATEIAYAANRNELAIDYAHLCLRLSSEDLEVLSHLTAFYQDEGQFEQGIEAAERLYAASRTLTDQIFASFFVLRGLMRAGGYWQEAIAAFQRHEWLLTELIKESPDSLDRTTISRLTNSTFPLPYIRDQASANRLVQNGLLRLCQANIQSYAKALIDKYHQRIDSRRLTAVTASKVLRIGYLSHCFRQHSVGWLSRWLFQYHDREQFKLYSYFVNYRSHVRDPLQDWFVKNSDEARLLGREAEAIAEQVDQDEIDILIDLDSITADISCEAMAMKPAPVQVTWLGWDASGLPAIDYFIADPYVLPEAAESYYSEKIWRMPQTYIAVDGFEVGVPTLRRDQLNIPADAIVYLSAQTGYKRYPDTVRLQMQILQAVPNSYFLIKGTADAELIKRFFTDLAEAEGVEGDRLRFLSGVPAESVHRANLGIADVVLDTFPYNGATTTLETLWMGIPIVTRVGEQFASRNSYTMMMNAGITEGIAWTDEEYVEWGVRLGEDAALRQQIAWKLWRSRQTAPLWNAKQFTREMEAAYQEMWKAYIHQR